MKKVFNFKHKTKKPIYEPPRGRQSNIKVGTPPLKGASPTIIIYDEYENIEEMEERERLAQLEVERRKLCVAPAYNKGAYQYVFSEEQAKDIGK